jgi:hypothetical protein
MVVLPSGWLAAPLAASPVRVARLLDFDRYYQCLRAKSGGAARAELLLISSSARWLATRMPILGPPGALPS